MSDKKPIPKHSEQHEEPCEAIHGQSKDGNTHVVSIGNLRVLITNDDGSWFAQGLEIDYATEGNTLAEVKKNFEDGLFATVQQHLNIFGSIEKLLQPAPVDAWKEFYVSPREKKSDQNLRQRFTQIGLHVIESIEYLQEAA